MKKFIISLVCCAVVFCGYYVYKNKNRLYTDYKHWKRENPEVVEKSEKTKKSVKIPAKNEEVEDAIAVLSKTVEELSNFNKKMDEQLKSQADSITSLHVIIDSLSRELASKPKIKIQTSPYSQPSDQPSAKNNSNNSVVTKNAKPKNEKNLPIARGDNAVELKRFFTERYDNR